jgi:predicted transcriptional regulator of viral defense system
MGTTKHLGKVLELFNKSPIVDFGSIARIVGKRSYAKLLVSNLLKKGKIHKAAKGKYTAYEDSSLAVLCYTPAYLGLQSAMSIHGIWEQETIPVIITTRQVRTGKRICAGGKILVKRTGNSSFFGITYLRDGDFYLPYSDVEKTCIDMVVFRQDLPGDILSSFRKRIDKNKLARYLKRYSPRERGRIREKLSGM